MLLLWGSLAVSCCYFLCWHRRSLKLAPPSRAIVSWVVLRSFGPGKLRCVASLPFPCHHQSHTTPAYILVLPDLRFVATCAIVSSQIWLLMWVLCRCTAGQPRLGTRLFAWNPPKDLPPQKADSQCLHSPHGTGCSGIGTVVGMGSGRFIFSSSSWPQCPPLLPVLAQNGEDPTTPGKLPRTVLIKKGPHVLRSRDSSPYVYV